MAWPTSSLPSFKPGQGASPWASIAPQGPAMNPQGLFQPQASSSGFDPNTGMPYRPQFQSILGQDGNLKAPFSASATTAGNPALVNSDMSPWLGAQNKRISAQEAAMGDQVNANTSLSLGSGMSGLAASGGLDSGARERLMTSANAQRMQGLAGAGQQAMASRAQADIQAQQMTQDLNRYNADVQNKYNFFNADAANRMSAFNAGNAIGGLGAQNAFNADVYAQDMGAWGAARTADAQAALAGREDPGLLGMGGVLGTGIGGQRGVLGTGVLGGGRLIDTRKWGGGGGGVTGFGI